MSFTADGLPRIGREPYRSGLPFAGGVNGTSISWVAVTGQIIADFLAGQTPAFDPARFATNDTTWANPFTAGERADAQAPSQLLR